MTDYCRSCAQPIRWVRTTAGKLMPLDAQPDPQGNVELTDDGKAVVLSPDQPALFAGERWMPHFATCPDGAEWSAGSTTPAAPPAATAPEAKQQAVDQVEEHADPAWAREALTAVRHVAAEVGFFTTDQVWARLTQDAPAAATHEPRAMGAVMRTAARQGLVARTDATRPSERLECHGRDVRIWRSLLDQEVPSD